MQHIPQRSTMVDSTTKTCHLQSHTCGIKVEATVFQGGGGSDTRITKATGGPESVTYLPPEGCPHPGPSSSLDTGIRYPGRLGGIPRCLSWRVTHGAEDNTTDGQRGWQPL